MKNTKIIVSTKSKSYPVYIGNKIISSTGGLLKKKLPRIKKIYIIVDKRLPVKFIKKLAHSLRKYDLKIHKLYFNEKNKNLRTANILLEKLLNENLNRSDCVIALGGGVTGDVAAFVSSIFKRGVEFINIPTTLLSQVDASIGGKTAVNSRQGKNLIGTFYQPSLVIIDTTFLDSLSQKQIISGYGEILKHSLIHNRKFFFWLTSNAKKMIALKNKKLLNLAIIKSCRIKSEIVNKDEKEKNLRMILNFGHTFGHGFEAVKKFSNKLTHGEAVLLGMIIACKLSFEKKLLPKKDLILIEKHYKDLGLPMNIKNFLKKNEVNKLLNFISKDKKNFNENINLILCRKIGKTSKPNDYSFSKIFLKKFLFSLYN